MQQRTGSVYIAVLGVVSVVTILALAGVAARKGINERARLGADTAEARILAQSAAELAMHHVTDDADAFATQAKSGVLFADLPLGNGTVSATIADADTSLTPTDATTAFIVVAEGNLKDARSRLSFSATDSEPPLTTLVREIGAVAYWPLDESPGSSTAQDVIGSNPGVYIDPQRAGVDTHVHGNPTPQNDWLSHRTVVPHSDDFLLQEGSIAFWARWDSLPVVGNIMGGVCKENTSKSSAGYLSVYLQSGDKLVAELDNKDGVGGQAVATGIIKPATWHYIVMTWANQITLYVDGVEVAFVPGVRGGLAAGGEFSSANTAPWMFGVRNLTVLFQTPAFPTFGSVSRVALFNRELTIKEIESLHEASSNSAGLSIDNGSFARVVD